MKKKVIFEVILLIALIYVLPMFINIKSTVYGFHTETLWDADSRTHETIVPDAGDAIEIPSEVPQSAWVYATENNCLNAPVRALWQQQGSPSDSEYDNWCYVTIDGVKRYCIALAPIYGLRGDYVDVEFVDGTKIACIITDCKDIWNSFEGEYGFEYNGQVYGHNSNGKCNIMEAVLSTTYSGTLLNRFPNVKQIINGGNMGNDVNNINLPQGLEGPYNYNSQDAGQTKNQIFKNNIITLLVSLINGIGDGAQLIINNVVNVASTIQTVDTDDEKEALGDVEDDTILEDYSLDFSDLTYSKSDIESNEILSEQIQVSDESSIDNPNIIKEIDVPNYIDNKQGKKELVYTTSTKIPVMPADIYSLSNNQFDILDINFFDTSNSNSDKCWNFIENLVSAISHIVIYISAALILVMLIWRSVLLVLSTLRDNPRGSS